jgi:hypothetical protein
VAKFVLDDFENQLKNFIKVFPRGFQTGSYRNKNRTRESDKEMIQDYKLPDASCNLHLASGIWHLVSQTRNNYKHQTIETRWVSQQDF